MSWLAFLASLLERGSVQISGSPSACTVVVKAGKTIVASGSGAIAEALGAADAALASPSPSLPASPEVEGGA